MSSRPDRSRPRIRRLLVNVLARASLCIAIGTPLLTIGQSPDGHECPPGCSAGAVSEVGAPQPSM